MEILDQDGTVAGITNATKDHTLTRKHTVCGPNPNDWASSLVLTQMILNG